MNVHFAHELTAESINDTGNGRSLALADEVEVEHALDSSWLEAAVKMVSVWPIGMRK
jgi:hypothetical protein